MRALRCPAHVPKLVLRGSDIQIIAEHLSTLPADLYWDSVIDLRRRGKHRECGSVRPRLMGSTDMPSDSSGSATLSGFPSLARRRVNVEWWSGSRLQPSRRRSPICRLGLTLWRTVALRRGKMACPKLPHSFRLT